MLLYVLDVVLLLMELAVGVDDVGDGVGDELFHDVGDELSHDVGELGSEQHDATGDLVDPSTSNAMLSTPYSSSLLLVWAHPLCCGLSPYS